MNIINYLSFKDFMEIMSHFDIRQDLTK